MYLWLFIFSLEHFFVRSFVLGMLCQDVSQLRHFVGGSFYCLGRFVLGHFIHIPNETFQVWFLFSYSSGSTIQVGLPSSRLVNHASWLTCRLANHVAGNPVGWSNEQAGQHAEWWNIQGWVINHAGWSNMQGWVVNHAEWSNMQGWVVNHAGWSNMQGWGVNHADW
jgi:hypothetical protein